MSKPVLKAVSKFLARGLQPESEIKASLAYFQCAKDLIDELIADSVPEPRGKDFEVILEPIPKPAPLELDEHANDWAIIVDKSGKLIEIEGLAQDATVELDGKTMFHKDAIGMNFKQGKVIDDGN